ncbi:hypothetical protein HBI81_205160 [Parastagonospora nodorum]|nr:hypothetical protein HBH51_185180 [Parastagonospora nodorum]KAH3963213.1 hypothetical protein HBH52_220500 [Parastagonospora nodorum]KAH3992550.1 hypothetical protein HBI10_216030 [Parastagonospora nodorum]KAH4010404.1 hypothetical protein HBI13_207520 [Parastagonospora nodorum]KAH4043739.1 hypothetical protein HBH49_225700 [Parastagonospora nodorum]
MACAGGGFVELAPGVTESCEEVVDKLGEVELRLLMNTKDTLELQPEEEESKDLTLDDDTMRLFEVEIGLLSEVDDVLVWENEIFVLVELYEGEAVERDLRLEVEVFPGENLPLRLPKPFCHLFPQYEYSPKQSRIVSRDMSCPSTPASCIVHLSTHW